MGPIPWQYFLPYFRYPRYRCGYMDKYGRCCDRYGRCCDRYGRCRYNRYRPPRYWPTGMNEDYFEPMGAEPMLMQPPGDMDFAD